MKRRTRHNIAIANLAIVLGVTVWAHDACNAVAQEVCRLAAIGTANVAAVRDGRELRLAAIGAGDDSRDALQSHICGRALMLERMGAELDRYGRLVAFAYAGDAQQSLQQSLLEQGGVRVSARIGGKACADALLPTERQARAARRGLWADPNFAALQVENLAKVTAEQGHFAPVEGKVLSVRESGATI